MLTTEIEGGRFPASFSEVMEVARELWEMQ